MSCVFHSNSSPWPRWWLNRIQYLSCGARLWHKWLSGIESSLWFWATWVIHFGQPSLAAQYWTHLPGVLQARSEKQLALFWANYKASNIWSQCPERLPLFASFQNWSWKWIREFYPHFFLVELRGPLRWQPSLISKSTRGYPAAPVYAQECRACREQFRVLLSSDAQHYAFYAELQAPGPG